MKYDIKPIETLYNHIFFRSRLEATWAAFFDECDWDWDYEPCDLNGWFPDFCIKSKCGDKKKLLVEVKPYDLSDETAKYISPVLEKISNAIGEEILFLGEKPFPCDNVYADNEDGCSIGLLVRPEKPGAYDFDHALLNYMPHVGFDVCDVLQSYSMRLTGEYDGNQWPLKISDVNRMWGKAKRKTRYRG